mmetsp:Transcript_28053/g.78679  ORF Transcript_28053/g.78679 Transcript_28053/m.78679 type:complete len:350 (+) Transcript_28053:122-1171(+)
MAPTEEQARAARTKQLAGGKQPKARIQRYLKSIEPKLREDGKNTLLLKGIKCSDAMGNLLKDLRAMRAPNVKLLTKKNFIVPFESDGQQSLEFLCTKNDCALFAVASTNKKRPNNLVLGRTFDHQVLDMVELGVLRYKSIRNYGGSVPKKRLGSKPLMMFLGDMWQHDSSCQKVQNMFIDLYRGNVVDKLILSGVDHVLVFIASEHPNTKQAIIHQRTFFVKLKKNPNNPTSKVPAPFLMPCGPDFSMQVRRTQFASPDLWKAALKQPQGVKKKKVKNQSTNLFGETIGRLHVSKQNVDKMQGRKSKALRRAEKTQKEEEAAALDEDLAREREEMDQEFEQTYGFQEES